jgi:hypothetical protein
MGFYWDAGKCGEVPFTLGILFTKYRCDFVDLCELLFV